MHPRLICLVLAIGLVCPLHAGGQQSSSAKARIQELNTKAMDEYDALEFDAAKELLEQALEVAEKAGLKDDPVLVQTFLNLGVVYGAGLNDRISAVRYFAEALKRDRKATLSARRATPILEEMFAAAKENVGPEQPPPPAQPPFNHVTVDEAPAGEPIALSVTLGPEVEHERVVLFYKSSGEATYSEAAMQESAPGTFSGTIPAEAASGRSVYYYIEVQDAQGTRTIGHGSNVSPNIVALTGGGSGGSGGGQPGASSDKVISLGVMVGTGLGIVYGGQSEHEQKHQIGDEITYTEVNIKPGGAWAPFHIAPEVSYHLSDDWHLSVLGRIQVVNAVTPKSNISVLGMLRAKRYFGEGSFRWYVAFGGGGGQIRHRIPLGDYDKAFHVTGIDQTANDIVDTRVAGLGAVGAAWGFRYMFTPTVGWALELNGLILIPDFAANLDLNTGMVLSF